jgi:hypothetical protein
MLRFVLLWRIVADRPATFPLQTIQPLLTMGSFLGRMAITLAGFYLVMGGGLGYLLACFGRFCPGSPNICPAGSMKTVES